MFLVRPNSEVAVSLRHFRFALNSEHPRAMSACPKIAKLGGKGRENGANFGVCGYYSYGYD